MDLFTLNNIIKSGENEKLEFKSSFRNLDSIGEAIASFSSKNGGQVIIGIDDGGNPIGIEPSKKINDEITQLAKVINPNPIISIEHIPFNHNKEIIIINIDSGNGMLYSYKGVSYERYCSTNKMLSPDEYFKRRTNSGEISFGDLPAKIQNRTAYVPDINGEKIMEYLKIVEKARGKKYNFQNTKQILLNLGLMASDNIQVTNNAILLFGKDPQKFIPNALINIMVYSGEDKTSNFIRYNVKGTLYDMLNETLLLLDRHITKVSKIEGLKRISVTEYPIEALREGLINSIAHRDYWYWSPEIFIDVYKNRIEIVNPAIFPFQGYTFENITKQQISIRRNKKIADMLDDLGLMEKQGMGLLKIKKIMLQHGLKEPCLQVDNNFVRLIFYGVEGDVFSLAEKAGVETDLTGFNVRQIKLLERLEKIGSISPKEYKDYFPTISLRQAQRDLKSLYKKGLVGIKDLGKEKRYTKI